MDGQAIKATLGKNIKVLRSRKGFTQAVLAEKRELIVRISEDITDKLNSALNDAFKQYLGQGRPKNS